jgi:hypothetical protein
MYIETVTMASYKVAGSTRNDKAFTQGRLGRVERASLRVGFDGVRAVSWVGEPHCAARLLLGSELPRRPL